MESTPRPLLNVIDLSSSQQRETDRRRVMKKVLSAQKGVSASKVLARYRRKQRRALDETDSDPDPYHPDYIFYCLEGGRKD